MPDAPKLLLKALLCALLLALPTAFAQGFYVGVDLSTPLSSDVDAVTDLAEIGAQLGFDPVPGFGVRLAAEGNPLNGGLKLAFADAVFRFYAPLSENNFYTGFGLAALYAEQPSSGAGLADFQPVVHALAGGELRAGTFGFFGELLPSYLIGQDFTDLSAYFVRLRGGVNVHF